jgi:4-hydroxy-tetrahydrodipicolinate reductase
VKREAVVKIHIGINGAAGRMGQRLVHLSREDPELVLVAALEAPGHPRLGEDMGELCGLGPLGVAVRSDVPLSERLDVLIDFSAPEGTMTVLPLCVDRRIPLVVATTGHSAEQKRQIEGAAHHTALLMAPNMSLSVNVLFQLVRQAAQLLRDKDFDVEIVERHHRFKKDAPSGTALHFARIVQEAMGGGDMRHGREGLTGERPRQEIGMHALRVGDNVGEHAIIFSTLGETLELTHKGHTRDSYARGTLLAAKFLASKPAGWYTMNDVLGLPGTLPASEGRGS